MYAHIVEGQVESLGELPQAYNFADGRSTGNFDLLDEQTHLEEGWYPLVDTIPTYDEATKMLGDERLTIEATRVSRTWTVVDRPAPEPVPPAPPTIHEILTDALQGSTTFEEFAAKLSSALTSPT